MAWDDTFGGAEPTGDAQSIELFGSHLRLTGRIHLGRFGRLTDFINATQGFVRIYDVRVSLPDGRPTDLTMPELMIDQDEIALIGQQDPPDLGPGIAVGFIEPRSESTGAVRKAREFLMFTPSHTISGKVHIFGQTDVAGFVDATDPHFVPVTDATVRSLADDRIVSHYAFVLINRKQMIAASKVADTDEATADGTPDTGDPQV